MRLLATIFLVIAFFSFLLGWHVNARGYGYSLGGVCVCISLALFQFGAELLR